MKPEALTRDQARELVRRVQAGEARADVAARFGISRSTVDKHLRLSGTRQAPPRPAGPHRGKDLSWMGKAKCRGWLGFTEMTVREQLMVCKGLADTGPPCGVQAECLAYGLTTAVGWAKANEGPVYGAQSPRGLAALQKQQRESVAS